jgi:hypothetical protein
VAIATNVHGQLRISYRAKTNGTYYVEARLDSQTTNPVLYRLALARS